MLFIYILVAAVVAAVALEQLARFWFRRGERHLVLTPGRRLKITLDLSFFPSLHSPIFHSINRDGERGGPPPPAPGEGLYRVLIVGGSASICGLLDQAKSFGGVLEELLNAPEALAALGRGRVHVGCIAKSQVDARGVRIILERILPEYRGLDLLIVMCGASDVLRWLGEGAPGGVPASPVTERQLFDFYPGLRFRWLPRQSALLVLARRLRARLFHTTLVLENAGRVIREEAAARAAVAGFEPLSQDPAGMLRSCGENMYAALRFAAAHAGRALLVRQPWWDKPEFTPREEAGLWLGRIGDAAQKPARFLSTADLYRLFSMMDSTIAGAAEAAAVPHIDLKPALRDVGDAFYDHAHFTGRGARIAAQAVAAAILEPYRMAPAGLTHVQKGTS